MAGRLLLLQQDAGELRPLNPAPFLADVAAAVEGEAGCPLLPRLPAQAAVKGVAEGEAGCLLLTVPAQGVAAVEGEAEWIPLLALLHIQAMAAVAAVAQEMSRRPLQPISCPAAGEAAAAAALMPGCFHVCLPEPRRDTAVPAAAAAARPADVSHLQLCCLCMLHPGAPQPALAPLAGYGLRQHTPFRCTATQWPAAAAPLRCKAGRCQQLGRLSSNQASINQSCKTEDMLQCYLPPARDLPTCRPASLHPAPGTRQG